MKAVDVAVSRRAAEQLSLVGRREALDLGLTERQLELRVSAGMLVRVQPRVYRVAAAAPSWEQAVLAASLAAGPDAVVSHRAAARLWGLRGATSQIVDVTVRSAGRRSLSGAVVHRTTKLEPVDRTTRQEVPVTTPARTLLDLGAVAAVPLVESALEDALLRRLVTFDLLTRTVERLGGPGRRGAGVLRRLLEARGPGAAPTESPLEDALFRLLRRAGLPLPVRQYEVGGVRLDMAYPDRRLGIEADSRIWHGGRDDVQRNSDKANLLLAHGWRVLHFTWGDVHDRPDYVVAGVAKELAVAWPA